MLVACFTVNIATFALMPLLFVMETLIALITQMKSVVVIYLSASIQITFITSHVGIEPKCSSSQFKCSTNNQCIDVDLVCDEKWDCSEGEDEISCG